MPESDATVSSVTPAGNRERVRLRARLVRLAAELVDNKFLKSHRDVLAYQEEIFDLQRDIQAAIGRMKRPRARGKTAREHLDALQQLRWMSRRLGDSVAWSLLLLNRKVIYPLGDNAMVPLPTKHTDGTRGVFLAARGFGGPAWGVPVIHDITSILRIGDVTFMLPGAKGAEDAIYRTFELKTSRVRSVDLGDGTEDVTLSVQLVTNEAVPNDPAIRTDTDSNSDSDGGGVDAPTDMPRPERRPDRRLAAQLKRMDRAVFAKNAPMDDISEYEGEGNIHAYLLNEAPPRWAELRRAIRKARRDGYAFFELDEFVGYTVYFNKAGLTPADFDRKEPLEELVRSVTHEHLGGRNSVTVTTLPDMERDTFARFALPFYLWKVPWRAIDDILRDKLAISAVYNTGRLEELLEAEGFRVEQRGKDSRDFVTVAEVVYPGGERATIEGHAPWRDIITAVMEFRGARSFVQRSLVVRDFAMKVGPERFIAASRSGVTDAN